MLIARFVVNPFPLPVAHLLTKSKASQKIIQLMISSKISVLFVEPVIFTTEVAGDNRLPLSMEEIIDLIFT